MDSSFFTKNTLDELESIINGMHLYSELEDTLDIDYNNARFGDTDITTLHRERFRKAIDETVAELLPQLKVTVNNIA